MGSAFKKEAFRLAMISAGHFEFANADSDLSCDVCDIPLLERQAVWADDVAYCHVCAAKAEARAEAEDRDTEERIGEYERTGSPDGGL